MNDVAGFVVGLTGVVFTVFSPCCSQVCSRGCRSSVSVHRVPHAKLHNGVSVTVFTDVQPLLFT